MQIQQSVTPLGGSTFKFGWVVTKTPEEQAQIDMGKKVLHTITVAIIADPVILPDGTIEGRDKAIYKWAHDNPNNGLPQYTGDITVDVSVWYPDWSNLLLRAYVCKFNDPDNPISDQYHCFNAEDLVLSSSIPTAKSSKGKGRR